MTVVVVLSSHSRCEQ